MTKTELVVGEIVQLSPFDTRNKMFSACMMVVTESKSWGAQGYVQGLGKDELPAGQAYYRATWEEMEQTHGVAAFIVGEGVI